MVWLLLILAIALILVIWAVLLYNGLVAARQRSKEAWSGIDVQLKRRSDLVPNLIETVKGYVAHEAGLLDALTRSRAQAATAPGVADRARAEGQLGAAISRLFAVAEAYPDLKASKNFQDLHASLDEIEEDIQHARRYYNAAARDLNIKMESFPSTLIAQRFDFENASYFELEDPSDRAVPQVRF
ncbi:LemA family protein [Paracoccus aurantiacus]|uniref:LemA family protein n=1 Tax=Paracoccus aurantiacus TaxID=2599412 RepID=A0A5C6S864_9RHOB|nr:LemA family protein [Paracoccus aurantiacus]TXB70534.1 LemA family protein [Paracoccus aurantiacus]